MQAPRVSRRPLTLWTVGHSTWSIEQFLELLQVHDIRQVADVRAWPGSRRYPQFNAESLRLTLGRAGIDYHHIPELGGRRKPLPDSPNTAWRNESFRGYADHMRTPEFRRGLRRLLSLAAQARTAMMCAEALWWRCHRALISDALKASGHGVEHIMNVATTAPHPYTSAARIVNGKLSYAALAGQAELGLQTTGRYEETRH
jgi:uncharacterized protein (DUF488 family)